MIRLRGHTVLCLQGFRGKGYSPVFVDNLSAIHQCLAESPEQMVELLDGPDAVCGACPHRAPSGCSIDGEASEEAMRNQDREVLARLGLRVGDRVRWSEVLDRIAGSLAGVMLPRICGGCRWLPLGYCAEGIDRVRAERTEQASPIPSLRTDTLPSS